MARGFLSGIFWGGTLGLGLTGVVSVIAPLPKGPELSAKAPAAVAGPERVQEAGSGKTSSTADRAPITGQVAPQTDVPAADDIQDVAATALASADQPKAGGAGGLATPTEGVQESGVTLTADAPVLPTPQALAPMAPAAQDVVVLNTTPAAPPPPSKEKIAGTFEAPAQPAAGQDADTAAGAIRSTTQDLGVVAAAPQAPARPSASETTAALADSTETAPRGTALEVAPLEALPQANPPAAPVTPQTRQLALNAQESVFKPAPDASTPDSLPAVSDDQAERMAQAAQAAAEKQAEEAAAAARLEAARRAAEKAEAERQAAAEAAQLKAAQAAAQTATAAQEPTDEDAAEAQIAQTGRPQREPVERLAVVRRAIGTPSITLTNRNTGVTINRPTASEAQPIGASTGADETDAADQRPILQHAQAFENPDEKPLMSIVLIDDGTSAVAGAEGIAALRNFPYPLSFAVDTGLADAADRMALYRAEGLEVMALIDLPEGAQPTDVETTLGVLLPKMEEVVGVLEGTEGGLQGSRAVADQVTAVLAQSGHGLLTQDKGLNTMPKLARKEGVPAAPVFRDFDSKGQSTDVIRRFLDQAAFKAGQEGAVVMLGRLRPDTVSALLLWGLQDRASKVALAPISAVLMFEP